MSEFFQFIFLALSRPFAFHTNNDDDDDDIHNDNNQMRVAPQND